MPKTKANEQYKNVNTADELPKYNTAGQLLSYDEVLYPTEKFTVKTIQLENIQQPELPSELYQPVQDIIDEQQQNQTNVGSLINSLGDLVNQTEFIPEDNTAV